jgi:hypothetical protein
MNRLSDPEGLRPCCRAAAVNADLTPAPGCIGCIFVLLEAVVDAAVASEEDKLSEDEVEVVVVNKAKSSGAQLNRIFLMAYS